MKPHVYVLTITNNFSIHNESVEDEILGVYPTLERAREQVKYTVGSMMRDDRLSVYAVCFDHNADPIAGPKNDDCRVAEWRGRDRFWIEYDPRTGGQVKSS